MIDLSNITVGANQQTAVVEEPKTQQVANINPDFFQDWNQAEWKVQNITMEQLKKSRKTLVKGKPLNDIEHFQLIQGLIDLCNQHGLEAEIIDMFAANQGSQDQPGIEQDLDAVKHYTGIYKDEFIALGQDEKIAEQNARIKATTKVDITTIRRVFCTIKVIGTGLETENCWTNLAVSYTPTNIQVGIGQMVKICHNQTILGSQHYAYTSTRLGGNKAVNGFNGIFNRVSEWLNDIHGIVDMDREMIKRLMHTPIQPEHIFAFIGYLTTVRVAHDSSSKVLRHSDLRMPDYPLDAGQINRFTERLLIKQELSGKNNLTAWDLYNAVTEEHKPAYWTETGVKTKRMEIHPMDFNKVIPQNMALLDAMKFFGMLPADI